MLLIALCFHHLQSSNISHTIAVENNKQKEQIVDRSNATRIGGSRGHRSLPDPPEDAGLLRRRNNQTLRYKVRVAPARTPRSFRVVGVIRKRGVNALDKMIISERGQTALDGSPGYGEVF